MKQMARWGVVLCGMVILTGCQPEAAPMVEVGKTYRFYFDPKNQWVEAKVMDRTTDGWILLELGGMWINANQLTLVIEKTGHKP